MFKIIGHFAYRRRFAILVAYALLTPLLIWASATVFPKLKAGGFEVHTSESWIASQTLETEIKSGGADILALWTAPSGTVDDVEALTAAFEAIARVEKDPSVVSHVSWYETSAPQLVTKDKTRTFLMLTLRGADHEKFEAVRRLEPLLQAPPMTTQIGGVVPVASGVERIIRADLIRAEAVALPITAVMLFFIFGSGASASLPLLLGILSLLMSLAGLRVLTELDPVSIFAVNIVSLLGLGLAIDYSLFLVTRFREELALQTGPPDVEAAIVRTVGTTGRAVAFSGFTVAASLLGLFFFPQMFLRSMAKGGILVVLGCVALSLTLLPALMAIMGTRIDALRLPFMGKRKVDTSAFWHKLALAVMKRPIIVTVAVLVPVVMLGLPFQRFDPAFPDYRILPREDPAFIANEILDREFDGDQLTPIDIAVTTKGPSLSRENLELLWGLSERLVHIADGKPELAQPKIVSGLFTLIPGATKESIINKLSTPREELERTDKTALMGIDAFAAGQTMRFAILLDMQYNKPEAVAVVNAIRALELPGLEINVGGPTAYLVDLQQILVAKAPWMLGTVILVMFVVLFLVFGSVTLPIKAMLMNALSICASFGAIVWVFQDGRFAGILHYTPLGISDAVAPLLMFCIVFGLSMDYEVLILARIQEEYRKTGDNDAAVAVGLAKTGGLITSAALLLVVVIGAFGTSHIVFMKSLGMGMALAVLLDATVIRALLVPAAMKLMGKWNWWAPAPLTKLWKKMGLDDVEH
ncbi:MAG: MMPL family transporter [Deltaproteobacteria bacterium]|nr:MMPL family transporter [Deltaproteobacteria bacterium]